MSVYKVEVFLIKSTKNPKSKILSPFHPSLRRYCRLLELDETFVTLLKTCSSNTFSLFALFSTIMIPLRGNCSCILFSLLSFFSFSLITHIICHCFFHSLLLVPASYHTNHSNFNLSFPDSAKSSLPDCVVQAGRQVLLPQASLSGQTLAGLFSSRIQFGSTKLVSGLKLTS